jgi:hypothetical protein
MGLPAIQRALKIIPEVAKLRFRLGLAESSDAITGFPLSAFFEQFYPLEALQNISFCAGGAGGAQAAML